MHRLLLDAQRRLRNGWWILVFVALIAATRFLYGPLTRGLRALGAGDLALEPLPFLFVLGVTWVCARLRRESLASVGFGLDRRWLRELAAGTLLGVGSLALAVGLIWTTGGLRFELDAGRSALALVEGLYVFLAVALFEEALFRGFLFQRLLAGLGVWPAQILVALLFALGHGENPGMDGATRIWATLELGTAALMLGLAYLRTRSLALPVGIHLGWNWAMGHVLGFGVSGYDYAGWFRPLLEGRPDWLTGGAFGPEASVFGVVADLTLILLLWRWKGSTDAASPTAAGQRVSLLETAVPGTPAR